MNEKDKEFARMLDAALRTFLGLPPSAEMEVRIVQVNDPEEIFGLTNTLEGVRTQIEYATLEARLFKREYMEVCL